MAENFTAIIRESAIDLSKQILGYAIFNVYSNGHRKPGPYYLTSVSVIRIDRYVFHSVKVG